MTDKNRQKGNESVGEKSDGLARDIEAREALKRALQRAFQFGQTYWMQADSESYSENRKAATTHAKYNEFVEQTLEALARPAPEALGAAKGDMPACKGMNCGATDGVSHSLECQAQHAAAIAGGEFVK